MANLGSLLLVSDNPELHQTLGQLARVFNLSLINAETVKEGFTLFKIGEPDSVIFDLRMLRDLERRARAKSKLKSTRVPILFLNDSGNGVTRRDELLPPLSLEPIVRFVARQNKRLSTGLSGSLWDRLRVRLRAKHA